MITRLTLSCFTAFGELQRPDSLCLRFAHEGVSPYFSGTPKMVLFPFGFL